VIKELRLTLRHTLRTHRIDYHSLRDEDAPQNEVWLLTRCGSFHRYKTARPGSWREPEVGDLKCKRCFP
jgi:hypothetical protein